MPVTKINLFLDIDGLFANFDKRVYHLSGYEPGDLTSSKLWKTINHDENFFLSLELIEGSEVLWNFAKNYNPVFLTGAPSLERFTLQKIQWIRKTFGPQYLTIVLPRKQKKYYSTEYSILVDDNQSNIDSWNDERGVGVFHHNDYNETVDKLQTVITNFTNELKL